MVSEPEKWIDDFKQAGADQYTFHLEATGMYYLSMPPCNHLISLFVLRIKDDVARVVQKIRAVGMKAGVAIKPKTSAEVLINCLLLYIFFDYM